MAAAQAVDTAQLALGMPNADTTWQLAGEYEVMFAQLAPFHFQGVPNACTYLGLTCQQAQTVGLPPDTPLLQAISEDPASRQLHAEGSPLDQARCVLCHGNLSSGPGCMVLRT
jgi:hypothetical protein